MKIKIIYFEILFGFLGVSFVSGEDLYPLVTAKLSIFTEAGQSVEGAKVTAYSHVFPELDNAKNSAITDQDGICMLVLRALGNIDVTVEKDNHYMSVVRSDKESRDERLSFDPLIRDGFDPRTPGVRRPMKKEVSLEASITLREIKKPIPLYGKRIRMDIPARDVWLGYDFEVGDWVKPHGKGIKSDMRIRSCPKPMDLQTRHPVAEGVATLEIDFGEDGGLVRVTKNNGWLAVSEMKMPHLAPETGYDKLPVMKIEQTNFEDSSENGKAKGYFFRTRVKRDGEKILSANYGKMWGEINYIPVQREGAWLSEKNGNLPAFGSIEFIYYFNPTPNDRNLEFDIKENLFKRLDASEWVRQP